MPDPQSRRAVLIAVLALIAATLFWAGNYVLGSSAVESIDPISLVLLRWAIALVPLVLLAQVIERPRWREVFAAWRWLIPLSVFGLLGYNLLLYAALQFTDPFTASLINAFNPALIALAAAMFLRERLTGRTMIGVLIALVGVLVVLSGGDLASLLGEGFGRGEVLMIGVIAAWTAYTIIVRRAPRLPPITATAVQAIFAVGLLTPVSLATGGPQLPTDGSTLGALLFIGIFPSVLSYLLWNHALTVLPASTTGVFLNLITVHTAVFTIVTGQPYTAAQVLGGLVVITGVVLTSMPAKKGRRTRGTG